mmetsp:Transcript_40190/g.94492  ORF Transcript_40190/g.94492 Transcript_40190/m.94492 type:complete len:84 (-) Transcript_40190:8-259(-)
MGASKTAKGVREEGGGDCRGGGEPSMPGLRAEAAASYSRTCDAEVLSSQVRSNIPAKERSMFYFVLYSVLDCLQRAEEYCSFS